MPYQKVVPFLMLAEMYFVKYTNFKRKCCKGGNLKVSKRYTFKTICDPVFFILGAMCSEEFEVEFDFGPLKT